MFRFISKWLISRAIDLETPLPGWLRRQIDRDDRLRAYERASRELVSRLRQDSASWSALGRARIPLKHHGAQNLEERERRMRWTQRSAAWGALACAVTACLVYLMATRPWTGIDADPVISAGPLRAEAYAPEPGQEDRPMERNLLLALWRSGQANINALTGRLNRVSGEPAFPRFSSWSFAEVPVKRAHVTTRRVLDAADAAATSQGQHVAAGAKSAYAFFAHRLPMSVARLVGLGDG